MLKKISLIVSFIFFLLILPEATFASCGSNELFTPCDPSSPGNPLHFTDEEMAQRITEWNKRSYERFCPAGSCGQGYQICKKYIGGPVSEGAGTVNVKEPWCIFEWSNGSANSSGASSAASNPLAGDISSKIPELNPLCWHPKDCAAARKQFGTADDKSGFVSDASTAPCNVGTGDNQWGRCLPAGTTKTEISFGGKDKFSNIGEFIMVMYKYLLTIASIAAVVVIIIAGAQWTASGGNSEAISSAKKRIGGAIIGLFIAYMSYFVLNTINPALVNLRLPQVWMVRSSKMLPEFCAYLKDFATTKFAFVADSSEPDKPLPPPNKREYSLYNVQGCGNRYLAENGGDTTCVGNGCESTSTSTGGVVACVNASGDRKNYECITAVGAFEPATVSNTPLNEPHGHGTLQ